MHKTLKLFAKLKRSTDGGIQIKFEFPDQKKSSPQPYVIPKKTEVCFYLPEIFLSVATKDWTRCKSKDHRTHGLQVITRHAGRQFFVEFLHHEVIIVFVCSMVSLVEHK